MCICIYVCTCVYIYIYIYGMCICIYAEHKGQLKMTLIKAFLDFIFWYI